MNSTYTTLSKFPIKKESFLYKIITSIKNIKNIKDYLSIISASLALALPAGAFLKTLFLKKIEQSYSHALKLNTITIKLDLNTIMPSIIIILMFTFFYFFEIKNSPNKYSRYNSFLYILKLFCYSNILIVNYITYIICNIIYLKKSFATQYYLYTISFLAIIVTNLLFLIFIKYDYLTNKRKLKKWALFSIFVMVEIITTLLFLHFIFYNINFFLILQLLAFGLNIIPYTFFKLNKQPKKNNDNKKVNIKFDLLNYLGIVILIFFCLNTLFDAFNTDSIGDIIITSQKTFVEIKSDINYTSNSNADADGYLLFKTEDDTFIAKGYKKTKKNRQILLLSGYKYVERKNLELSEEKYSIKLND